MYNSYTRSICKLKYFGIYEIELKQWFFTLEAHFVYKRLNNDAQINTLKGNRKTRHKESFNLRWYKAVWRKKGEIYQKKRKIYPPPPPKVEENKHEKRGGGIIIQILKRDIWMLSTNIVHAIHTLKAFSNLIIQNLYEIELKQWSLKNRGELKIH